MSFINTIAAPDARGPVLEMYRRQEDHWGFVPNYATVFCHRPEVMARWGRLLAEIRRPVDDRRFELVTLAVALELRHSACSLAHGQALADIIGADDVAALARGQWPKSLTNTERAIFEYAQRIARDAAQISSRDVESLKAEHGLTDADIFDIAAIASARAFFTKLLDALGCAPESSFMQIESELRHALTVGRSIAVDEPEYTGESPTTRRIA